MIRVLLYGLGPIGAMVARQLATRDGFRIVGAVDVDPAKLDVGSALRMVFRIKEKDGRRHFNRYFWKAAPI